VPNADQSTFRKGKVRKARGGRLRIMEIGDKENGRAAM
jgi:hypothetical protein